MNKTELDELKVQADNLLDRHVYVVTNLPGGNKVIYKYQFADYYENEILSSKNNKVESEQIFFPKAKLIKLNTNEVNDNFPLDKVVTAIKKGEELDGNEKY